MSDYIREVTSTGVSEYGGDKTQDVAQSPGDPMVGNSQIDEMAIAQVMGLEPKEMSKYADNLQTLQLWAQKQGYKDPMELKWVIRSLQDKLGSPSLTERWITIASRYAFLELEEDRAKQERMGLMK